MHFRINYWSWICQLAGIKVALQQKCWAQTQLVHLLKKRRSCQEFDRLNDESRLLSINNWKSEPPAEWSTIVFCHRLFSVVIKKVFPCWKIARKFSIDQRAGFFFLDWLIVMQSSGKRNISRADVIKKPSSEVGAVSAKCRPVDAQTLELKYWPSIPPADL